jgi:hypothetical protein
MNMKNITWCIGYSMLLLSTPLLANDFKKAADKLCDKMTVCIVEQMDAEEDLPPQMKEMAKVMAANMCSSLYEFENMVKDAELTKSAVACFESVEQQSCSSVQQGFETPECKDFEKLTQNYAN